MSTTAELPTMVIDRDALDDLLVEYRDRILNEAAKPSSPVLLSIVDAAKRIGVSRRTLYTYMNRGEVHTIYVGSRRLVPQAEVERITKEGIGKAR